MGYAGPHDSGTYCSRAEQTGFFHPDCGNWRSEYGHFFLSWYSGLLINHVDKMVAMGSRVLAEPRRPRTVRFPCDTCSKIHRAVLVLEFVVMCRSSARCIVTVVAVARCTPSRFLCRQEASGMNAASCSE